MADESRAEAILDATLGREAEITDPPQSRLEEKLIELKAAIEAGGGGGGGTTSYNDLTDKPTLGTASAKNMDAALSQTSTNPVENKTIYAINERVKVLEAAFRDLIEHYGIKIDKNNSDTEARITYMYDAVGFTPAAMDFTNGVFNIGSWANAFFVKNCYPAMVKTDTTIDYKLDPNDHSLKENGTASDYDNLSYDGNAFAVFDCKIWLKMYEDENYQYIEVSNYQLDEDFHDYPYVNADGVHGGKLYYPMYPGYYHNGVLRSIAGVKPSSISTAEEELAYAKANGASYWFETWSHHVWFHMLLLLMSKDFGSQGTYGNGNMNNGTSISDFKTNGEYSDKGMFFGTNGSADSVKCFYCENVWANRWSRCLGFFLDYTAYSVKMTSPYIVTETGHEEAGYDTLSVSIPSANGFLRDVTINENGLLPKTVNGSATTYIGDYFNIDTAKKNMIMVGGSCSLGALCGSWCLSASYRPSFRLWSVGASLYLIP